MEARHGTLVANTVSDVVLDSDFAIVEVVNVDGAAIIYLRTDAVNPTVAGDNTRVLPAVAGASLLVRVGNGVTDVRLISAGTPKFAVTGLLSWEQ